MHSRFIFLLIFFSFLHIASLFPIHLIEVNDSLKNGANAVLLDSKLDIHITSKKRASIEKVYKIAILDKSGDDKAFFIEYYSPAKKIKTLNATIFDQNGKILKKLSSNDFSDYSATKGSLITDDRVKILNPAINKYPFIIEYTVQYEYTNGFFILPTYFPIFDEKLAIVNSSYCVTYPSTENYNIITKNIEENNLLEEVGEKEKRIRYAIKNKLAVNFESFSGSIMDILPTIRVIPIHFNFLGNPGIQNNWKNFGRWIYDLTIDNTKLSENTKQDLDSLKLKAETRKELMKSVYEYMQSKTRYVSIQLGIGGWKPMNRGEVDELGYGDCKALVHYTRSLYEYVNIPAFYTLVNAGNRKSFDKQNTYNQFNHVILCLPNDGDTIWLECTNQSLPFGHLGDFTDDKDVLLIKKDDSHLSHTRVYSMHENIRISKNTLRIANSGHTVMKNHIQYIGLNYDDMHSFTFKSREEQLKALYNKFDDFVFSVNQFELTSNKDYNPQIDFDIEIQSNAYTSLSNTRMFVPINPLHKNSYIPEKLNKRLSDITIYHDNCSIDTTIFTLPDLYEIEYIIDEIEISKPFGLYRLNIIKEHMQLVIVRKLEWKKGVYSKTIYEEFRDFFIQISKIDNEKLVLKKKNS